MPIFAYRCDQCGFAKDVLQKRSDPPLTECPSCGKQEFRKQLAAPSFQLKGSRMVRHRLPRQGQAEGRRGRCRAVGGRRCRGRGCAGTCRRRGTSPGRDRSTTPPRATAAPRPPDPDPGRDPVAPGPIALRDHPRLTPTRQDLTIDTPPKPQHKPQIRSYFVTGLLIWVPLVITLWVLNLIVSTMDQTLQLLPAGLQPELLLGRRVPGVGVLLTLVVIFVTGLLARNFIGQGLVRLWEALLARIPIVRSIYSSVKQVSDTVLSPNGQAFRKALLVQYPRAGVWTIAFQTGSPAEEVRAASPGHGQRLRADHAQPDVRLLPDDSAATKSSNCT